MNNNYLWVSYPTGKTHSQTAIFRNKTQFIASFIGKDHAMYTFRTHLIRKETLENIPAFVLRYPEKMERIQRRNYKRVDAALDIAVRFSEHLAFTSVTKNISGGGIAAIMPTDLDIPIYSLPMYG